MNKFQSIPVFETLESRELYSAAPTPLDLLNPVQEPSSGIVVGASHGPQTSATNADLIGIWSGQIKSHGTRYDVSLQITGDQTSLTVSGSFGSYTVSDTDITIRGRKVRIDVTGEDLSLTIKAKLNRSATKLTGTFKGWFSGTQASGSFKINWLSYPVVPPPPPPPPPPPSPDDLTYSFDTHGRKRTLVIDGTDGNDNITVRQESDGLVISNKTWSTKITDAFSDIRINAGAGDDVVTVDDSVTAPAALYAGTGNDTLKGGAGADTLVTLGGGTDVVSGGNGIDSYWVDNSDVLNDISSAENSARAVHRITGFINDDGQNSIELNGQDLVDPYDSWNTVKADALFGLDGPSKDDINQGQIGDCYFLSGLSAIAGTNPEVIRQSIVDLGDGTFAVRFYRDGSPQFFHVDGDITNVAAGNGADDADWVRLMEKAFAFFRYGQNTYASLDSGYLNEPFDALGVSGTDFYGSGASLTVEEIAAYLAAGKAVTLATGNGSALIVGGHAYQVDHVSYDASGNASLVLRNPWGQDGYYPYDGVDDGYVTVSSNDLADAGVNWAYAGNV